MTVETSLQDFTHNVFSQNGEDGILGEVFRRLGINKGVFCEFGAWDGKHLSNAYALYEAGWTGWFIEGDRARFRDLIVNIDAARAEAMCAFVEPEGPNSLDALLQGSDLYKRGTTSLDLLSIDIDSDDLRVWRSVKAFRPKVVVIEYNPTIPIDVFFENPRGTAQGNSARSIFEQAVLSEYGLIGATATNMIFLDRRISTDICPFLSLTDPALDLGYRFFFGYDGTLIQQRVGRGHLPQTRELLSVPWNGAVTFAQPVAKPLRRHRSGRRKKKGFARFFALAKIALSNQLISLRRIIRTRTPQP